MLGPVVETEAIDVVNEGLGRGVLGQDQGVVRDLNMVVREGCRYVVIADNRRAVDERPRLDQGSLDQQRMIRRDKKVARRNILRDCASPYPDRENAHFVGKSQRDGLNAEPVDRNAAAVMGEDEIATFDCLYSNLAVWGPDQRAGHEADRVVLRFYIFQFAVIEVEVAIVRRISEEKEVAVIILDDDAAMARKIGGPVKCILVAVAQRTAGNVGNFDLVVGSKGIPD